jgi:hypothetical protein
MSQGQIGDAALVKSVQIMQDVVQAIIGLAQTVPAFYGMDDGDWTVQNGLPDDTE